MRTVLIVVFLFGLSNAAIQQQRSPVYQPSVTSAGSTVTSANGTPMKSSSSVLSSTSPMTPAPLPPMQTPQPVAQARESVASDASMIQSTAVNPSTPSQNYYVYYYPHNGAAAVGQPNSSSVWSLRDYGGYGVFAACAAMIIVGGGILYYRHGTEVKTRALRELKDLSAEDAARMARGVLRAIEKFSAINNE